MVKLPILSGGDLIKILQKNGFVIVRQKGSHVSLRKDHSKTVIPLHDELSKGTLLGILNQCGLSKSDLFNLIHHK